MTDSKLPLGHPFEGKDNFCTVIVDSEATLLGGDCGLCGQPRSAHEAAKPEDCGCLQEGDHGPGCPAWCGHEPPKPSEEEIPEEELAKEVEKLALRHEARLPMRVELMEFGRFAYRLGLQAGRQSRDGEVTYAREQMLAAEKLAALHSEEADEAKRERNEALAKIKHLKEQLQTEAWKRERGIR